MNSNTKGRRSACSLYLVPFHRRIDPVTGTSESTESTESTEALVARPLMTAANKVDKEAPRRNNDRLISAKICEGADATSTSTSTGPKT